MACANPKKIGGIPGGLGIAGKGLIKLQVAARKGKIKELTRLATHAPDIPVDLIPPQAITRNRKDGWFKINEEQAMFEFSDGKQVATGFDPITKLPMVHFFEGVGEAAEDFETALHTCVAEEANQNLSAGQKWLLRWHFCLARKNMAHIKWLARQGLLGRRSKKIAKVPDEDQPTCASCNHGKQKRRPAKGKLTKPNLATAGALKKDWQEPGDGVAADQLVVKTGGRLFSTRGGREKKADSKAEQLLCTWLQESSSSNIKCPWEPKKHWSLRHVLRERLPCPSEGGKPPR